MKTRRGGSDATTPSIRSLKGTAQNGGFSLEETLLDSIRERVEKKIRETAAGARWAKRKKKKEKYIYIYINNAPLRVHLALISGFLDLSRPEIISVCRKA